MRSVDASHGAVVVGVLPFVTALAAWLGFGERHAMRFWLAAAAGSAIVAAFALRDGGGALSGGDALLLVAVAAGGIGYAAGGRVARDLGGIAAILWALALAAPLTLPVALWLLAHQAAPAGWAAWGALAYVTLVSQLLGFFAWYNGLALGGIARVGQVQLLQVFFTLGFAGAWFGERVPASTWLAAAAVATTIVIATTSDRR
jgi:drug/metabolite transporter (DMT)-like permease